MNNDQYPSGYPSTMCAFTTREQCSKSSKNYSFEDWIFNFLLKSKNSQNFTKKHSENGILCNSTQCTKTSTKKVLKKTLDLVLDAPCLRMLKSFGQNLKKEENFCQN